MTKTLHHRACHLCEAICGLNIEVSHDDDGRALISSIKGDPEDPFSRGHVCPKAVALQDIQNDPDRLRQPHKRVGEHWQAIGWDEAFAPPPTGCGRSSRPMGAMPWRCTKATRACTTTV